MIPCFDNYCEGEYQPKGTGFECTDCEDFMQMHAMVEALFVEVFPNRAKDKAFIQFTAKQKEQTSDVSPKRGAEGRNSGVVEA